MIGTSFLHYEITAKLGEGGMGEVYRARDGRLGREVAIKVLPPAFTEDEERLARFEREAQLLAQLQHPHIGSIYGLEESDGRQALVMELVEGPTLDERLARGALSVEETLPIALQIAEALEAAHEKGIIHRDLKPQNVKFTPQGQVKVLDFGLAKAMDPTVAASGPKSATELAASPTLTLGQTVQGVILGTAAYMSPEQAKGAAVDKRADIWAFGVVLYEMLTGRRLFEADTAPETLAGVLKSTIDLETVPPQTPPALRRLLRRCLERDPRNRLRDIGDARIALRELRDESAPGELPESPRARHPGWTLPLVALFALILAGAAFFVGRRTSATGDVAGSGSSDGFTHFTRLTNLAGLESSPALSPDGEFVAYVAFDGDDRDVFLLRVGGQKPINLTEDSPADEEHPTAQRGSGTRATRMVSSSPTSSSYRTAPSE